MTAAFSEYNACILVGVQEEAVEEFEG